jgi:ABC-type sugar transport system permease subunit
MPPAEVETVRVRSSRSARRSGIRKGTGRRTLSAVPFLAPALVIVAIFQLAPVLVAMRDSLYHFTLVNPSARRFVGLNNYREALSDAQFGQALHNTGFYIVGALVLELTLGFLLALLVNRPGKGILGLRLVIFAPVATSAATIAVIWQLLYQPQNGLFNGLLGLVGISAQPFIVSQSQALPSVLMVQVWQDVGFVMLLFLTGLQALPHDVEEAAQLDGAGRLARLRWITLPLMKRTILYAAVYVSVGALRIFTPIFVLTQGGPNGKTSSLAYYVYQTAFESGAMGYASALSMIVLLITVLVVLVQARLLRTQT